MPGEFGRLGRAVGFKRYHVVSRPRIAAVVTEYRKYSHAEHIVDRFLYGYSWNGRHHRPEMDVVSLYVDQRPTGDLSRSRAGEFPSMKIVPTVGDALTLGTGKLAVDGVLLIGEHGKYRRNEKGQTQYPRYEFFEQITDVFRHSGRSVPVFNDKHLSWNWEWARRMADTSRELGFALMAGSSLPVTRRLPAIDFPYGQPAHEVLSLGVGSVDSYDFHHLEAIQSLVERRRGGETGVVAVQAIRGDGVWQRMQAGSWDAGGWDPQLFDACICRSIRLHSARPGYSDVFPRPDDIRKLVRTPVLYRLEYADGLRGSMLMLNGLADDIMVAVRPAEGGSVLSTLFYLPPRDECNFFSPLVNQIETLFHTGKSPRPLERTLLTTGLTAAGVESLWQGQRRLDTPHLAIRYRVENESVFWRT